MFKFYQLSQKVPIIVYILQLGYKRAHTSQLAEKSFTSLFYGFTHPSLNIIYLLKLSLTAALLFSKNNSQLIMCIFSCTLSGGPTLDYKID